MNIQLFLKGELALKETEVSVPTQAYQHNYTHIKFFCRPVF